MREGERELMIGNLELSINAERAWCHESQASDAMSIEKVVTDPRPCRNENNRRDSQTYQVASGSIEKANAHASQGRLRVQYFIVRGSTTQFYDDS